MSAELRTQLGVIDLDMAASLLCCSRSTLSELASAGKVPHVRYGRTPVFPLAALLEHLNAQASSNLRSVAASAQPLGILVKHRNRKRALPVLPSLD